PALGRTPALAGAGWGRHVRRIADGCVSHWSLSSHSCVVPRGRYARVHPQAGVLSDAVTAPGSGPPPAGARGPGWNRRPGYVRPVDRHRAGALVAAEVRG